MSNAVILASCASIIAGTFALMGFLPLAPFLLPKEWVGVVLSAQGVAQCAAVIVAGPLVDRLGTCLVLRRSLDLQMISLILTVIATFAVDNPWPQLFVRLLQGFAFSSTFNACIALIADHFQEPARAQHVGTVLGAGVVGMCVGIPLVGGTFDMAASFELPTRTALAFVPAYLPLAVAYIALFRTTDAERTTKEPLLATEGSRNSKEALAPPTAGLSFLRQIAFVYSAVGVQALPLVGLLVSVFAAECALQCAVVLEFKQDGLSSGAISLALLPGSLVSAIAAPLAGRMANTPEHRRRLLIVGPLVIAVGLVVSEASTALLGPWWRHISRAIGAVVVSSLGICLVDAPSISLMTELAEANCIGNGQAVAASELAVQVGVALGPYFGSIIFHSVGFDALCGAIVVSSLCVTVLCAVFLEADRETALKRAAYTGNGETGR